MPHMISAPKINPPIREPTMAPASVPFENSLTDRKAFTIGTLVFDEVTFELVVFRAEHVTLFALLRITSCPS